MVGQYTGGVNSGVKGYELVKFPITVIVIVVGLGKILQTVTGSPGSSVEQLVISVVFVCLWSVDFEE